MDYKNDISEIIDLINCTIEGGKGKIDYVLKRFTQDNSESFLKNRANTIKKEILVNYDLEKAMYKLASVCSDDYCNNCSVRKYCNRYIDKVRQKAVKGKFQMVDLFCGAGGLSLGFTQEGFVTVLANDIEKCCVDTYAHNHPETPRDHIVLGDIRLVTDHLEELLKDKEIDVIVGGPPCQGFSMANRQRLIDDPRNHLYKSYVEIVKRVCPKFFVMENVRGMLSVANQVKEDFRNIGYEVECHILNAKDYGVPQNRERLIFIGNRIGLDNETVFGEIFRASKSIPNYMLKDALYGLRKLDASKKKNATKSEIRRRKLVTSCCYLW